MLRKEDNRHYASNNSGCADKKIAKQKSDNILYGHVTLTTLESKDGLERNLVRYWWYRYLPGAEVHEII